MTGVTHMLAAAAIYEIVPIPKPIGLGIALVSHFVLDAIPHYEISARTNYVLGVIGGVFLLFSAFCRQDIFILLAALLGALPDLNKIVIKNKILIKVHRKAHFKQIVFLKTKRPFRPKIYRSKALLGLELIFLLVGIYVLVVGP